MEIERRSLLTLPPIAALAALSNSSAALAAPKAAAASFGLSSHLNADLVLNAYNQAKTGVAGAAPATQLPYVYAFYDEAAKKFSSPVDVKATLDSSKTYVLTTKLHAFNIKKSDQENFRNLNNQVQLSFNATAPNPVGNLTWIFMNAIDIFAGKNGANPAQLTKFLQADGSSGVPLASQPTVTVTKGTLTLQAIAYGQKKAGFWSQFIHTVAGLLGSPITTTALTGFGIPALATDALEFVSHSLDVMTQNEGLVKLWSTGGLDFGIDPNKSARFYMTPGLWMMVDYDYAKSTNFLQGHTIDIALESFQLLDKSNNPADANYLVTDLVFTAQL